MPKILLYITSKVVWTFLFWGSDSNENRAHVHVGRKGTENLCKIWLEPDVEVAVSGDLTSTQINEILSVTKKYRQQLLEQWKIFKNGKKVKIIKVYE